MPPSGANFVADLIESNGTFHSCDSLLLEPTILLTRAYPALLSVRLE